MESNGDQLVVMSEVYSNEYYQNGKSQPVQVLRGISFEARAGQVWSILGKSIFEIMLLTEIMAGARSYQKGRCSLSEHGMMRRKRTVLPHTFYIGSTNMLFINMKVLEYLMLATSRTKMDALSRQQEILDRLIAVGLDYVALTPISQLKPEEKAVVTLICATFSQSQLLVLNLPRLRYDAKLIEVMTRISVLIKKQYRTLIITTENNMLAQAISTDIMLLQSGVIKYCGDMKAMLERYDKVLYTIQTDAVEVMLPILVNSFPQFTCRVDDAKSNAIEVFNYNGSEVGCDFFDVFSKSGLAPDVVTRNEPNLRNACREVLRNHDLQE